MNKKKENLVDLFVHESVRVFNDRFTCHEDNEVFYQHLSETVFDYFRVNIKNTLAKQQMTSNLDETSIFLYGDFVKNEDRVYHPFTSWKQLVSVLSEYQMRSNMSGHASSKQIVFFKEAVEHICRACRVLRQPSGHMLLIGNDI